jgi:hypothetical protein
MSEVKNELTSQEKQEITIPGFGSLQGFELAIRAAKLLAQSSLVPKEYQNNLPNCVIALNMANRMNADPLMVMQNLYVVNGKPGWSSQFLISTFNTSGRFSAIRYKWTGERGTDSWGCIAWAIEKSTGETLEGSEVTIGIAKREGWYEKSGSKWKTMPQQMLMYRAASWFIRAYAPELAMGMHTVEELKDIVEVDETEYEVKNEIDQNANKEELDIKNEGENKQEQPKPEEKAQKQTPQQENKSQQQKQSTKQQTSFDEGPGF